MPAEPLEPPPSSTDFDDVFFRPVPARNAFEETVERLVHAIKLGVVRHGERLPPERELAPRLGVSRVTLREAIRALQQAGYVEPRRGRAGGAFVTHRPKSAVSDRAARRVAREMGEDALTDALRFRQVLEPGAAEQAAARTSQDAVALLRRLTDGAAQASVADYRAADSRLHIAIAELVGSASLKAAVVDVQVRLSDLLAAIPRLEPAIDHANAQHAAIVRAIAAGDGPGARAAMDEHLEATASLVRGFLRP
ncbi:MAG: FadR/GntR family transcriptional regulator [Solirubrobacteraceae bacterium]